MHKALKWLYNDPCQPSNQFATLNSEPLFVIDESVVNQAIAEIHKKKGFKPQMLAEPTGKELIEQNYKTIEKAVDKGIKQAKTEGLKYEIPEQLTQALKDNAFIFSGFKAYHTMNEAGLSLKNEDGGIKSFEEFKKEAEKVFKEQGLNLQAEYRYAAQSAQMAAKWNDIQQDGDDCDLQYRTAGDDKVREEHAKLNGTTLPPSDEFWKSFYPPNGWGCRCTAVQVNKGKYKNSNSAEAIANGNEATAKPNQQIFRTNTAQKQQVFPEKHPYYKAPEEAKNIIDKIVKPEVYKKKTYKSGGVIETPTVGKQNANESEANLIVYTELAKKYGEKYRILPVNNAKGVKNPDAENLKTKKFSDAKMPNTTSGASAIENSIKTAAKQRVEEVVIYLTKKYPMRDIRAGLKSALQPERNSSIKIVIIRFADGEVRKYNAQFIRDVIKTSRGKSK